MAAKTSVKRGKAAEKPASLGKEVTAKKRRPEPTAARNNMTTKKKRGPEPNPPVETVKLKRRKGQEPKSSGDKAAGTSETKISVNRAGLPRIPDSQQQVGRVFVCGQHSFGQLGLGEDDNSPAEVMVPRHVPLADSDPEVRQVAAGGMHSVALTITGEVYTTGVNDEGALGRRTDAPIWEENAGDSEQGDASAWGLVEVPTDFGSILTVSAGDSHTAALTEFGAVWGWGTFRGDSGPFGFLPGQKIALLPTLVYVPASAEDQIISISSGADHVLALRRDGSVLSWGYGAKGQLGRLGRLGTRSRPDPEHVMLQPATIPLDNVRGLRRKHLEAVAVEAGSFGSFILTKSGHTLAFGVNASGQLGFEATTGTVDDNLVRRPTLVQALTDSHVAVLGAGKAHTLVLTQDGSVLSFGLQTYGRLGRLAADNVSDAALAPGAVDNLADVEATSVIAGHDTSAVISAEGQAFLWGMGTNYQLGKRNDSDEPLPRKLETGKIKSSVRSVLQVAMGGQHTLFLMKQQLSSAL